MYKHILIPTDGSKTAQKAIDGGIAFARESGARVTLFTAVPEYRPPSEGEMLSHKKVESLDHFEKRSRKEASALLGRVAGKAKRAGVRCGTDYAFSDNPWRAIIDAAKRNACDVIFIGSHGRRGLAALWYGSETKEVLTHSDIPTLVYR